MEIDLLLGHWRELFPDLNLEKLVKSHTDKVPSYKTWKENHCRERQYLFQIRKCQNPNCCIATTLTDEALNWLPDPVSCEGDQDHFKPYEEVNGTDTSEIDRTTFKVVKAPTRAMKRAKRAAVNADNNDQEPHDDTTQGEALEDTHAAAIFTTQNARGVIKCVECLKPRIYHSNTRITERHHTLIAINMSEFDYTCGAEIADPEQSVLKTIHVRPGLTCAVPIELSYYGSGMGQPNICCFCANEGAEAKIELKQQYKTVLLMCEDCENRGLSSIVYRPYGKTK